MCTNKPSPSLKPKRASVWRFHLARECTTSNTASSIILTFTCTAFSLPDRLSCIPLPTWLKIGPCTSMIPKCSISLSVNVFFTKLISCCCKINDFSITITYNFFDVCVMITLVAYYLILKAQISILFS